MVWAILRAVDQKNEGMPVGDMSRGDQVDAFSEVRAADSGEKRNQHRSAYRLVKESLVRLASKW
jgi:hypothetical protein